MTNEKFPPRAGGALRLAMAGAGLLSLLIAPRIADAATARVRWLPPASNAGAVTGYRIYVRNAGAAYGTGAPIWSGNPTPAGDGSLSTTVTYTTAPSGTNYFAVVAMRNTEESGLSEERSIGTVNSCRFDVCTSKTACSFGTWPDGTACDDDLYCNGPEVCLAGTCDTSANRNCADAFACTVDACDETNDRCTHNGPPGCCVACDTTDPCLADACAAGDCTAPAGKDIEFSRIKLLARSQSVKLVAKGKFELAEDLDPSLTGAVIEMRTADGTLVYSSTIPPYLIRSGASKGRYRYTASRSVVEPQSNGIDRLDFRVKDAKWLVTVMGDTANLADASAESSLTVSLKLGGEQCVRQMHIPCLQKNALSVCR